ncbi:MAG: biotin transporter BioY [Lachnospiraceae bacterium]|nr:biotin transporter BioY [Lachnospiraceae bacterium]
MNSYSSTNPNTLTPLNKLLHSTLFAALISICSQIIIPLPFIPINMALFGVFLAGSLLGPVYGSLSVIIYCLLGLVGAPVFAGFRGGLSHLVGMTGGFIAGYIFTALVTGFLTRKKKSKPRLAIAMSLGLLICYIIGSLWFMFVTGNNWGSTLIYCVFPFIIGDIIKIILAIILTLRLKQI